MLDEFNKEVLVWGAEACLPANLSNEWLEWLSTELNFIQDAEKIDQHIRPPSCALAAIFKIVLHKNSGIEVSISEEEMFNKMQEFLIELELEKVSRWTDIKIESATLDTIFTSRDVAIEYKKDIH